MRLVQLIDDFLAGKMSAPEFEKKYIHAWRIYRDMTDTTGIDDNTQVYLDRVFTTLDVYCADPRLKNEDELSDIELLNEIILLKNEWKAKSLLFI